MFNDNDKYQNLLTQLHELNRNIVLNENEKVEQITQRIDSLEEKFLNASDTSDNKRNEKFFMAIIIILLINTLLLVFISFSENSIKEEIETKVDKEVIVEDNIKNEEKINIEVPEPKTENIVEEKSTDDILSFNEKSIVAFEEDEKFLDIKPIIRKGTPYNCKDDDTTYKIPYTVEIKGKLYSDKFKFILQEDSVTKECTILKEYM
ncbi:MAG: hypothetical protein C0625_15255 [Arcobacter sp.]|nr:MAG: hypothetical protein C0625_15255 [Arcobacter sp.]